MSATQLQLRRGTEAQCEAMTPVVGEPIVDTTNTRLRIGDGATAGGIPQPNAPDIQKQLFTYGTVGGTANAITLTNEFPVGAYVAGQKFQFKATASNSGATTVAVDGLTTKNIMKMVGGSLTALSAGNIVNGGVYEITYDGTQFQLAGGASAGFVIARQQFTASGTYTPSSGMQYCDVIVVGGGAGGRAGGSGTCGPGGGYGGIAIERFTAADIGASQTVTIGAGGASNTNGGTTSLGALISATGGTTGGAASSSFSPGAAVGSASTGNVGTGYGSGGGGGITNPGGAGKDGIVMIIEYCSA